jgi:hypothetical protein
MAKVDPVDRAANQARLAKGTSGGVLDSTTSVVTDALAREEKVID